VDLFNKKKYAQILSRDHSLMTLCSYIKIAGIKLKRLVLFSIRNSDGFLSTKYEKGKNLKGHKGKQIWQRCKFGVIEK
jgi:hypothetical protein